MHVFYIFDYPYTRTLGKTAADCFAWAKSPKNEPKNCQGISFELETARGKTKGNIEIETQREGERERLIEM